MLLITTAQRQKLLENGRAQRYALDQKLGAIDFEPVVKIFTPDGSATWLLTELDPDREYLAFGLCDCGLGEPELGFVSLHELAAARGNLGLPLEQDLLWRVDLDESARRSGWEIGDRGGLSMPVLFVAGKD